MERSPGLLPFRSQVLILTGVLFFVVPPFFLDIQINAEMVVAGISLFVGAFVATSQRHVSLQYYFYYMLFTVFFAYFLQTAIGIGFIMGSNSIDDFTPFVATIISVHVAALLLGHWMGRPRAREFRSDPSPGRGFQLGFATLAISAVTLLIIWIVTVPVFFAIRADLFEAGIELSGLARVLVFVGKALPYLFAVVVLESMLAKRRRSAVFLFLLVVLAIALVMSNPANTGRFISLSALSMLVIYGLLRAGGGVRKLIAFVLVTPFLFLVVLPITSRMRHGTIDVTLESWALSFSSLEFSALQLLVDAVKDVSFFECCSNRTLSAVLLFVPRSIWPSKNPGTGVEIAAANGYEFHNVALPSFVDFAIDFGILGVFFLSLVVGLLFRRADLSRYGSASFLDRSCGYSVIFFALIPIFGRGDLSTFFVAFYSFIFAYEIVRASTLLRIR